MYHQFNDNKYLYYIRLKINSYDLKLFKNCYNYISVKLTIINIFGKLIGIKAFILFLIKIFFKIAGSH